MEEGNSEGGWWELRGMVKYIRTYKKVTKDLLGDYVDCRLNCSNFRYLYLTSFDILSHPWHIVPNLQIIL